jgi:putative endopeptidase
MVRWLSLLAAGTALAGCTATQPAEVAAPAAPSEVAQPETPPAPKPTYGTFGFDEAGMDKTVAPGDNFYLYANGTWAKDTPIPADKSNYGAFNLLQDKSQADTRAIIEEAAKDPASKIGVAYNAYLDTAAIESRGLAPIEPWLNEVKGVASKSGYAALAAKADRNGIDIPFGSFVGQDDKDPDTYAMNLFQGGLGMPDRDYYLSTDAKLAETKAAYEKHLANVLTLAGEPNAAARAKAILAFETAIAKVHWTNTESRDADKTYNKLTLAELQKKAPGFDFAGYFAGVGAPNLPYILVAQPSAVAGIAKLIGKTPVGVLKDQLLVRSIEQFSDVLPAAFDQEQFAFYSNVLSGIPQQQERWKRPTDFTSAILRDDISKLYVAKYFPPET